jgi:hypothetical protein
MVGLAPEPLLLPPELLPLPPELLAPLELLPPLELLEPLLELLLSGEPLLELPPLELPPLELPPFELVSPLPDPEPPLLPELPLPNSPWPPVEVEPPPQAKANAIPITPIASGRFMGSSSTASPGRVKICAE